MLGEPRTIVTEAPEERVARSALIEALRRSETEELSLLMHMRRVFDPRGLPALRSLRQRIDSLRARLADQVDG